MSEREWDVLVIGAGQAGCEAALAAARAGVRVLLVSSNLDLVATMPCNCSIGGPAKAYLVREIDTLGGEMGRSIDRSYTHIRMLNTSKGPAVQALRAQADKALYGRCMKGAIERVPRIGLHQGLVERLAPPSADEGRLRAQTREGGTLSARRVVVATGTFLNGLVHIGRAFAPAGRAGEPPAESLSASLRTWDCLGPAQDRHRPEGEPQFHRRQQPGRGAQRHMGLAVQLRPGNSSTPSPPGLLEDNHDRGNLFYDQRSPAALRAR